jgi:hypothetical protein
LGSIRGINISDAFLRYYMASTSTGPTGSTSTTAQPKDLGGNFKCLDCPDQPTFSSEQELKKHKDDVHGLDVQGKQTNTVPGISKESGY